MNRLSFLRNSLGAIAATVVGSKLGLVPKKAVLRRVAEYPLTPAQAYQPWKMFIRKGLIRQYDVLRTSDGTLLHVSRRNSDLALIGTSLDGTLQIEFVETINGNAKVERLCSAMPESMMEISKGSSLTSASIPV